LTSFSETSEDADTHPSWREKLTDVPSAAGGFAFLVVAALGSAVGAWVLLSDGPFAKTGLIGDFTDSGEYVLWVLLVVGQVGLWAALALSLVPTLSELWPSTASLSELGWPAALAVWFLGVLFVLTEAGNELVTHVENLRNPLPNHQEKQTWILGFGSVVAASAAFGIGLVHQRLGELRRMDLKSAETIRGFVRLRTVLHRLLIVEATILGSAILSLAAARGAIVAVEALEFPQALLIGYGFAGSAALVSVYGPVYATVLGVGRRILSEATPIPDIEGPDWPDRLGERDTLESLLRIDSSVASNAQAVLAILTPLVGSVLGVIVDIS
jgi:hypothetical protein